MPSSAVGVCERRGHVVAVADERYATSQQRSPVLLQRHHVGKRLTRMLFVAERVDDVQFRGGRGHQRNFVLGVGAYDECVHPSLEVARDVG
jgi:hypothetical protein